MQDLPSPPRSRASSARAFSPVSSPTNSLFTPTKINTEERIRLIYTSSFSGEGNVFVKILLAGQQSLSASQAALSLEQTLEWFASSEWSVSIAFEKGGLVSSPQLVFSPLFFPEIPFQQPPENTLASSIKLSCKDFIRQTLSPLSSLKKACALLIAVLINRIYSQERYQLIQVRREALNRINDFLTSLTSEEFCAHFDDDSTFTLFLSQTHEKIISALITIDKQQDKHPNIETWLVNYCKQNIRVVDNLPLVLQHIIHPPELSSNFILILDKIFDFYCRILEGSKVIRISTSRVKEVREIVQLARLKIQLQTNILNPTDKDLRDCIQKKVVSLLEAGFLRDYPMEDLEEAYSKEEGFVLSADQFLREMIYNPKLSIQSELRAPISRFFFPDEFSLILFRQQVLSPGKLFKKATEQVPSIQLYLDIAKSVVSPELLDEASYSRNFLNFWRNKGIFELFSSAESLFVQQQRRDLLYISCHLMRISNRLAYFYSLAKELLWLLKEDETVAVTLIYSKVLGILSSSTQKELRYFQQRCADLVNNQRLLESIAKRFDGLSEKNWLKTQFKLKKQIFYLDLFNGLKELSHVCQHLKDSIAGSAIKEDLSNHTNIAKLLDETQKLLPLYLDDSLTEVDPREKIQAEFQRALGTYIQKERIAEQKPSTTEVSNLQNLAARENQNPETKSTKNHAGANLFLSRSTSFFSPLRTLQEMPSSSFKSESKLVESTKQQTLTEKTLFNSSKPASEEYSLMLVISKLIRGRNFSSLEEMEKFFAEISLIMAKLFSDSHKLQVISLLIEMSQSFNHSLDQTKFYLSKNKLLLDEIMKLKEQISFCSLNRFESFNKNLNRIRELVNQHLSNPDEIEDVFFLKNNWQVLGKNFSLQLKSIDQIQIQQCKDNLLELFTKFETQNKNLSKNDKIKLDKLKHCVADAQITILPEELSELIYFFNRNKKNIPEAKESEPFKIELSEKTGYLIIMHLNFMQRIHYPLQEDRVLFITAEIEDLMKSLDSEWQYDLQDSASREDLYDALFKIFFLHLPLGFSQDRLNTFLSLYALKLLLHFFKIEAVLDYNEELGKHTFTDRSVKNLHSPALVNRLLSSLDKLYELDEILRNKEIPDHEKKQALIRLARGNVQDSIDSSFGLTFHLAGR